MRKNLVIVFVILLNVAALVLLLLNYKTTEFPENVFKKEKTDFDNRMAGFVDNMQKSINDITGRFADDKTGEESLREYFIRFMDNNNFIHSALLSKSNYKFVIKRSKGSYVAGFDNNDTVDLVKWKRVQNGEIVSEWDESFELSEREKEWFEKLRQKPDTILWFFNDKKSKVKDEEELFYCGYFHNENGDSTIILLRFLRLGLLKEFTGFERYDNINMIVETNDGQLYNLSSGINEFFRTTSNDTIREKIHRHLGKFKDKTSGMFTFRHDDDAVWTFFRRFDPRVGLHFYIITIPEDELLMSIRNHNMKMIIAYAFLVIFSLAGIYIVYFRRRKKTTAGSDKSLPEILTEDESRYLEFKSSLRWDYRQQKVNPALEDVVIKTIAAFGNSDGGTLLIGVDDDKNILGLENDFNTLKKKDSDYFEIHLRRLLHKAMGVKYVTENIRIRFLKHKKKEVCLVEVFKAGEPVFIETKDKNGNKNEKFYVRSGNSSHELNSLKDINDYIGKRF